MSEAGEKKLKIYACDARYGCGRTAAAGSVELLTEWRYRVVAQVEGGVITSRARRDYCSVHRAEADGPEGFFPRRP